MYCYIYMDKYFSTNEIASLFKVREITVRRWINRGWLQAIKIGKMYRVREQDLKKFGKTK